jgi:predicted dehydrogenase
MRHAPGRKNQDKFKEYFSLNAAIKSEGKIDGVLICSPTSRHAYEVKMMVDYNMPFLVEKPPSIDLQSTCNLQRLIEKKRFKQYDIAFNLRYYPVLRFIKGFLPKLGKIYSMRVYADSYLPNWRKGVDYRKASSAQKKLGGGVHRELVHEIDYIVWFLGLPEKVFAYVDKISNLEISSEDICAAIFCYKKGPVVELHLGYLSHKTLRGCQIIAENGTLEWDINSPKVLYTRRNKKTAEKIYALAPNYDFNETYLEELKHFIGIINKKKKTLIQIGNAADVMSVLEAIKISSVQGNWIKVKELYNRRGGI